MTEQEVLDFFESLRNLVEELKILKKERKNVMRDMAEVKAVSYEKPKITCTSNSDLSKTLERIYRKCEILDRKLLECTSNLADMRSKAYELINLCNDSRQRCILYDYYLSGESWDSIQKKYHYARTWPFILRRRAIRNIVDSIGPKE